MRLWEPVAATRFERGVRIRLRTPFETRCKRGRRAGRRVFLDRNQWFGVAVGVVGDCFNHRRLHQLALRASLHPAQLCLSALARGRYSCSAGLLCGSAADPEESDGFFGDARYAQLLFRVARRDRRCPNDGFLFPDSRTATALRSELSLSLSRIERDLYHDSRGGCVKGETKRAAHHRFAPDHRGHRARFDELNCDAIGSVVLSWQAMRLPYNDPANNGQSFSRVAKLVARAFSRFGGASFGRSNSAAKRCFQRAYFGGE